MTKGKKSILKTHNFVLHLFFVRHAYFNPTSTPFHSISRKNLWIEKTNISKTRRELENCYSCRLILLSKFVVKLRRPSYRTRAVVKSISERSREKCYLDHRLSSKMFYGGREWVKCSCHVCICRFPENVEFKSMVLMNGQVSMFILHLLRYC